MYKKGLAFVLGVNLLINAGYITDYHGNISDNYKDVAVWNNLEVGNYPIDIYDDKYAGSSLENMLKLCDMPAEIAESLETEELVTYALNYPYLIDIFLFDNIEDAFDYLETNSNVFNELFSREDSVEELIKAYSQLTADKRMKAKVISDDSVELTADYFVEQYVSENIECLDSVQAEKFEMLYRSKELLKNTHDNDRGISVLAEVIPGTYGNCFSCGARVASIYVTIKNRRVNVLRWESGGYNQSQLQSLNKAITDAHPSFVFISGASSKYNCHSYAWYSTSSGNNYWINDPANIYNNTDYYVRTYGAAKNGSRLLFWNEGGLAHSAIATSNSRCRSKLGHSGVYETTIQDMNTLYGVKAVQVYNVK